MTMRPGEFEEFDESKADEGPEDPPNPVAAVLRDKGWWERFRFWVVGRTPH